MNKRELKEALDEKGIKYEKDATNAELEALLPQETSEETTNEKTSETNEIPLVPAEPDPAKEYGDLSDFLKAYLKQNPRKFAIKWKLGKLKDL